MDVNTVGLLQGSSFEEEVEQTAVKTVSRSGL